jgi:hypothetical protein
MELIHCLFLVGKSLISFLVNYLIGFDILLHGSQLLFLLFKELIELWDWNEPYYVINANAKKEIIY